MKKEEKLKVGRPKLADKSLKRESALYVALILVFTFVIMFFGYKILYISIDSNNLKANVYNDHVNSCIYKDGYIDCGPNVEYLKYMNNEKEYIEVSKVDKSIKAKTFNYKDAVYRLKNTNELKKINK